MVENPVKKLKINKKANRNDQKSGYTPAIQLKKYFFWFLDPKIVTKSVTRSVLGCTQKTMSRILLQP
jgi:hypothetical protein